MQDNELENKTGFDAEWNAAAANLPRVEAPQYFEANVRSRIEERRTSGNGSLAFLKLAIPAAALAALALFFAFSGYISNDIDPIAVVSETPNRAANQIAKADQVTGPETHVPTAAASSTEPAAQNSTTAAVRPGETDPKPKDGALPGQPANNGGSQDLAVSGAKPVVMPKGLNPNPQQEVTGGGLNPQASVLIAEALRFAGVQGDVGPRGMAVSSVNENSPAQRAGLRPGDTIEAINETPVTATATLPGGTALRSIRVNRDGKTLRLSF